MSWDVFLFNTKQQVDSIEELDDALMEQTDFCAIFENHFPEIVRNEDHRSVQGKDFSIDYFTDDTPVTNKMLSLYGENALYELIFLAKKHQWQIFDTYLGGMVDLEKPEQNGYENFQQYLQQIMNTKE